MGWSIRKSLFHPIIEVDSHNRAPKPKITLNEFLATFGLRWPDLGRFQNTLRVEKWNELWDEEIGGQRGCFDQTYEGNVCTRLKAMKDLHPMRRGHETDCLADYLMLLLIMLMSGVDDPSKSRVPPKQASGRGGVLFLSDWPLLLQLLSPHKYRDASTTTNCQTRPSCILKLPHDNPLPKTTSLQSTCAKLYVHTHPLNASPELAAPRPGTHKQHDGNNS